MERAGKVLTGKYRIVGVLGRGPTGEVYEARHGTLDRPCAVKVFHPDVTVEPERVEAAFADLRTAASIGHPGIVDVFDTDTTDDGRPYFVMDLLDGHDLGVRIGGGRRLAPTQAVELVAEALVALGIAHHAGLVHGDLKPRNIYITQCPGESTVVKLLDFGASRLVRTGDDRFVQFAAPQFWSPEQAAGGSEIDHRTDLYAMGAVLYVCLTGRLPFDADDPQRVRTRIVSRPFPDPRALDPGLDPVLADVVLRATAGYADQRYGSAEGMLADLAPLLPAEARERLGLPAETAAGEDGASPRTARSRGAGSPGGADDDDEDAVQARRRSRTRRFGETLAVVSGPLALVAVIAVLIVMLLRGGANRAPAPPPPAAAPTVVLQSPPAGECAPAPAPAAAPAPEPAASPAVALPDTVRLVLENLPAGAAATVGGRPIEGTSAVVPRGDDPLVVTVKAPGYADLAVTVRPVADSILAVAMSPLPAGPAIAPPPPAAPPPTERPAAPTAPSPAAPQRPAPRESPSTVAAATAPARTDVPAPAPPTSTGTLRVLCSPWARVAIPGHGTRNTPFSIELPPGPYRLVLANNSIPGGSRPRMIAVDVNAGQTTKLTSCW